MTTMVGDVTTQWETLKEQIQDRSTAITTFVDDALDTACAQLSKALWIMQKMSSLI